MLVILLATCWQHIGKCRKRSGENTLKALILLPECKEWGSRGRKFESSHPDQRKPLYHKRCDGFLFFAFYIVCWQRAGNKNPPQPGFKA